MSITFPIPHSDRVGGPFVASTGQVDFPGSYGIQFDYDVEVTRKRGLVSSVLALGPDYTVISANDPNGFTIRLTAGSVAADEISHRGLALIDRTTSVAQAGRFSATQTDRELDRTRIINMETRRDVDAITPPAPRNGGVLYFNQTTGAAETVQLVELLQRGFGAAGPFGVAGPPATGRFAYNARDPGFTYLVTDAAQLEFYVRSGAAGNWLGPYLADFTAVVNAHKAEIDPHSQYGLSYDTRAQASAVNLSSLAAGSVILVGFAPYKKLEAPPFPVKAWHFQSVDGGYFQLAAEEITPYMFDGSPALADSGPTIRTALACALALNARMLLPAGTWTVNYDPASVLTGGLVFGYSILIGAGARVRFAQGAKIKQANGVASWNRTVFIGTASTVATAADIEILGLLDVDANVQNLNPASNNEHMHGVMIFNCRNLRIPDGIRSVNARGDNVLIGGTNETLNYGDGVLIGPITAKTAGRKCLVLHYCDNLLVGDLNLDNSAGGAELFGGVASDTDKGCIDCEPDNYTGTKRFTQSFGNVHTRGLCNDFTGGTPATNSETFTLNFGHFHHTHSAPSLGIAWIQYAITINCLSLTLIGLGGAAQSIEIIHAARLNVAGKFKVRGSTPLSTDYLMRVAQSAGNQPVIKYGELDLEVTVGGGLFMSGAYMEGSFRAKTAGAAFFVQGTGSAHKRTSIIHTSLQTNDSGNPAGSSYVYLTTTVTDVPLIIIHSQTIVDTRGAKPTRVGYISSGCADGLTIVQVFNTTGIADFLFVGADKFYRTAGGQGKVSEFVCIGTPEGQIAAPVGSCAFRSDGAAATVLYVKETGAGNTGWVAK